MEIPLRQIIKRKTCKKTYDKISNQYSNTLATIIANRIKELDNIEIIDPGLNQLEHPQKLEDLDLAADRIVKAIKNNEIIGIETDHDCDGQTAHAVVYYNLVRFGVVKRNIRSYIGHRLKEGYGLSAQLTKRILADSPPVSLIITADNGSSDELNIAKLKNEGIDVIVTDHHKIPITGVPRSAYACINPTREYSNYSDCYIAGCMVAWLLMTVVRVKLIEANILKPDFPKLLDSLDFVAVGTMADCVSLANSVNNRVGAILTFGEMLHNNHHRFWKATNNSQHWSEIDISGWVIKGLKK